MGWLIAVALGLLVAGGAIFMTGRTSSLPSPMRYRMTIEVETPDGLVTGSAVRQLRFAGRANSGALAKVTGEAVAVDLSGGRTLFALLAGEGGATDHASQDVSLMFQQVEGDAIELWPNAPEMRRPIITNPAPMLVTFGDLNDPKSIERVDPSELRAIFGEGTQLRRITVKLTSDPVTAGIEQRLPWLFDPQRKRFSSDDQPDGIPLGDYPRLFTTEQSN